MQNLFTGIITGGIAENFVNEVANSANMITVGNPQGTVPGTLPPIQLQKNPDGSFSVKNPNGNTVTTTPNNSAYSVQDYLSGKPLADKANEITNSVQQGFVDFGNTLLNGLKTVSVYVAFIIVIILLLYVIVTGENPQNAVVSTVGYAKKRRAAKKQVTKES